MSTDPVDHLFARAGSHNVAMAAICERAKVAQSTPSRWRTDRNGATYATIRKLNTALDQLIEEKGVVHDAHGASPPGQVVSPGKSRTITGACAIGGGA